MSLVADSVAHQVRAIAPISVQADSGSRAHRTVRTAKLDRAHITCLCCHFGNLGNLHDHSRCLFFLVLLPKSVIACHLRIVIFGGQLFPLQFQGQALVGRDCIRQIGLENGRLRHRVSSFHCDAVARWRCDRILLLTTELAGIDRGRNWRCHGALQRLVPCLLS